VSFTFELLHPPAEGELPSEDAKKIMAMSGAHEAEAFGIQDGADREALITMWQFGTLKVHVVKREKEIVGYALWTFGRSIMNKDTDAVLIAAYVEPRARGSGAFRLLLSAGKIAMSAIGATRIAVMVDEGSKMQKFFERDGAERISNIMRW